MDPYENGAGFINQPSVSAVVSATSSSAVPARMERLRRYVGRVVVVQHAGGGADLGVSSCDAKGGPDQSDGDGGDLYLDHFWAPTRPWTTGLFQFCSRGEEWREDAEICVIGCLCPSILHGFISEELTGEPCWLPCLGHASVWILGIILGGSILCHWGLAPCYSHPIRTFLRQRYGIEGNTRCETKEEQEVMDALADCCVHYWCHPCALCQEAREVKSAILRAEEGQARLTAWMEAPSSQNMD